MRNAECGMRNGKKEVKIPNSTFRIPNWVPPDRPAHPAEARRGSPERILFPPMLFARNALAPGPQAFFPLRKRVAKVKGGKRKKSIAGFFKAVI
jgi:hypothetical protein